VLAVKTTAANCHESKPLLDLLDKTNIQPGTGIHADKAYCSHEYPDALKSHGIKNGIQNKATKKIHCHQYNYSAIVSLQKPAMG